MIRSSGWPAVTSPASERDATLGVLSRYGVRVKKLIWDLRFTPRINVECVGLRTT